jgi:hypothetical protein
MVLKSSCGWSPTGMSMLQPSTASWKKSGKCCGADPQQSIRNCGLPALPPHPVECRSVASSRPSIPNRDRV